jgi:large subunit ribosomal protein L4
VGGGRAHPPKPQDWSYRPPRRVRVAALKSALSLILKEGRLTVVDSIDLGEVKTKKLAGVLSTLQAGKKTLVVDDGGNQNLRLSIRNLEDKLFLPPEGVNVYDLLRHDHLVLSKGAVKALEARCLDKSEAAAEAK